MRLLEPAGAERLTIAAIGDVGVVGTARARAGREGYDALFAALASPLRAADLGFANLEIAIAEPAWVRPGRTADFWQAREVAAALARAGVRVVSLANNHIMDCGPRGLERTIEACRAAGLATAGAGMTLAEARAPARFTVRGLRVVVLAYAVAGGDRARDGSAGVAPLERDFVIEDLKRWREVADVLVMSAHWGSMYVDFPPPRVVGLARAVAPLVDLVLGHHPHVTQGATRTGSSLVLYSLGDAVFNSTSGDVHATVAAETRLESAVFTARLAAQPGLDVTALVLDGDGVPHLPAPAQAARQDDRLRRLSVGLDDVAARFASESVPRLVRYEIESLLTYVKAGRFDRVFRLLFSIRPRHLPVLWQALKRARRAA